MSIAGTDSSSLSAAFDCAVQRLDQSRDPGGSCPSSSPATADWKGTVANYYLTSGPVNGLLGAYPSTTASMAFQQPDHHRELAEHVQETLGPHREVLEALADLNTELSEDAERALTILDELEAQE